MIGDGHPVNLRVARVPFAAEGSKVRPAPDAREAIAELKHFVRDLILIGIQVPSLGNVEPSRRNLNAGSLEKRDV